VTVARVRLREARPEGEAAFYRRTYPDGYRHDRWPDHVERVKASADLIERYRGMVHTAADLSCGDGVLLNMISRHLDLAVFGDLNGPPVSALVSCHARESLSVLSGILPDTLAYLPDGGVDLFILSETIEHMDDPDSLLSLITGHARYLFLSTPLDEPVGTGNAEHYWGWGQADIHQLLQDTGWSPLEVHLLTPESTRNYPGAYTFQLWMAVRA
jgi:hypothetical protein